MSGSHRWIHAVAVKLSPCMQLHAVWILLGRKEHARTEMQALEKPRAARVLTPLRLAPRPSTTVDGVRASTNCQAKHALVVTLPGPDVLGLHLPVSLKNPPSAGLDVRAATHRTRTIVIEA